MIENHEEFNDSPSNEQVNLAVKKKKPSHIKIILQELLPKWEIVKEEGTLGRNLMAAERTMLAWIRTAISCIALGVAIAKFIRSEEQATRILLAITGTVFTAFGLLILIYGSLRFTVLNYELRHGRFSIDKISSIAFIIFGVVVCALSFALTFM